MKPGAHVAYLLCAFIFSLSCSNGTNPSVPPLSSPEPQNISRTESGNHQLWYYGFFYIDPVSMKYEVVPARDVTLHLNVTKLLEQTACTNCVTLTNVHYLLSNNLGVTVSIKHPFGNKKFSGFDVRGIAMFKGTQSFSVSGLVTSSILKNEGELVNADGFTSLYNTTTAGNGMQGYLQGKMSAGLPNSTVNGYKRFITNDGINVRNYFLSGQTISREYEIHIPPAPFILGYAIDASWAVPVVDPVNNPNTDFPPGANCPEPWKVIVTEDPSLNTLTDLGGSTTLTIDVYDHQGKDSHKTPNVECPGLFTGTIGATWVEDDPEYSRWTVNLNNTNLAAAGKYKVLISVEDKDNDTSPPIMDLTAYQIVTVLVTSDNSLHGWAISMGGMNADALLDTVTDSSGNIYVTGYFTFTADFDPGAGEALLTAHGLQDVFLAKYDKNGNYIWAGNWGGEENVGQSIALYGSTVYVYGSFTGDNVDFDPGPGSEPHSSLGNEDLFISSFTTAGVHNWAVTWGGNYTQIPGGLAIDQKGRLYVGGAWFGLMDFDPGPGTVNKSATGGTDCFLMRMDSYANYQWVKTWGASGDDRVFSISGTPSGETWVAGQYYDTVDFDPGAGVDNHTSEGQNDAFVCRYDPNGIFKWAATWGSPDFDDAKSVAQDVLGYSWITGSFWQTVDFDPGSGSVQLTSGGWTDAYLLELDPDGKFVWCGQMGGADKDYGESVALDPLGNILMCGEYSGNSDLDPGPGHAYFSAESGADPFLIKLSHTMEFLWGDVWGGDKALAVYVDEYSRAYVGGQFYNEADLDPGPGVDTHTGSGTEAFLNVIPRTGVW